MSRLLALALAPAFLLLMPATASAASDETYRTVTVFGEDACPKPVGDEIVVCGRLPESERYRIPKALRKKPSDQSGAGASWGSRVEGLEEAQRFTMPGSCTAVGTAGQTGCTQAMLRQWFLERRAMRQDRLP